MRISCRRHAATQASAQLEQLTHIYVSAPLTRKTTPTFFFSMPITKSTKTQLPSGATEPSKENPKTTKSTKGFTEIDTSRLTPDQRELRRRRRSSERERAARVQRASADGDDRPGSPPSAGTKPTDAPRALVVEPQGISSRPADLHPGPSGSSTMITSGSKVERGQTTYTGETGRDTPSEYRESKPSELVVVPGDRVKRENGGVKRTAHGHRRGCQCGWAAWECCD